MPGGLLPPLILELRAKAGEAISEMRAVSREAEAMGRDTEASTARPQRAFSKLAGMGKAAALGLGGAAVVVGAESLKLGVEFQDATTKLVTGAGESEDQLAKVRQGILALAPAVGQGPQQLAQGLFYIESAGYHGAAGLQVLKSAAEGAKIGGADMTTVADGLTTAMNNYFPKASDAALVTSKLIATVGAGKTTMQDLSASLAHVLPFAKGLGIGFNDVMAAMATMTGEGIHAADASTYLKFTMMSLANETPKGTKALDSVGLSAKSVHDSLSKNGLSGTLAMITEAVGKKFPVGSAAYTQAIANIVGGTRGMAATLALTGKHMETFQANIKTIGGASTEAGNHVKGWSDTQKDLGTQLDQAKAGAEALGVKIGTWLIPKVTALLKGITGLVNWLGKHKAVAYALAAVIGGVLVTAIGAWIVSMVTATTTIGGMELALAPIALVIAAIGVAAYLLATHWKQVWGAIKTAALAAWNDVIKPVFGFIRTVAINPLMAAVKVLYSVWKAQFDLVRAVLLGAWNDVIKPVFGFIETVAIDPLKDAVGAFVTYWQIQFDMVKTVLNVAWSVIKAVFGFIRTVAIEPLKAAFHAFVAYWQVQWGLIKTAVHAGWTLISTVYSYIKSGLHAVESVVSAVGGAVSRAFSKIGDGLQWVWDHTIGPIYNQIRNAVDFVQNAVNALTGPSVSKMSGDFAKHYFKTHSSGGGSSNGGSGGKVQTRKFGGWIEGAMGQAVPLLGHGKEYVLSTDMLAGRQPIDPGVWRMLSANASSGAATRGSLANRGAQHFSGDDGGVQIIVQGTILDWDGFGRAVQKAMLQHGARNRQTYQPYKRG